MKALERAQGVKVLRCGSEFGQSRKNFSQKEGPLGVIFTHDCSLELLHRETTTWGWRVDQTDLFTTHGNSTMFH